MKLKYIHFAQVLLLLRVYVIHDMNFYSVPKRKEVVSHYK